MANLRIRIEVWVEDDEGIRKEEIHFIKDEKIKELKKDPGIIGEILKKYG